jgi:hypothetical protein
MKLLGQHPTPKPNLHMPTYSIFYLSPMSTIILIYNLIFFVLFYFIEIQLSLFIAFGQSFIQT